MRRGVLEMILSGIALISAIIGIVTGYKIFNVFCWSILIISWVLPYIMHKRRP